MAGRILGALRGYDHALIVNELGNEYEYFKRWMDWQDLQWAEQHVHELTEAEADDDALEAANEVRNAAMPEAEQALNGGEDVPEAIEERKPRYKPPPCKKCGGKMKVTSTLDNTRYLKCKTCGCTFKKTMSANGQ